MPDSGESAAIDIQKIIATVEQQARTIESLQHQLDWFKRQLFGKKSERFVPPADPHQMHLGELFDVAQVPAEHPAATTDVPAHKRKRRQDNFAEDAGGTVPFFDRNKVPVITVEVPNEEARHLAPDQYEVIGNKTTARLAQRPGSWVVIEYVRQLIKRRDNGLLCCPPAPQGVLDSSRADVSFLAGLLVDKFQWHLPLYRQHQRLEAAGFKVSRPWLTQLVQQCAQLLEPVNQAQFDSILTSRLKAMDETPIKAGYAKPGSMKIGYFWPVYGELDEVCFPYFESREHAHVEHALGLNNVPGSVLLSDGYPAYERYTEKAGVEHANCWVHCRRKFFDARNIEPDTVAEALEIIGALYEIEEQIRGKALKGKNKQMHRLSHSKPLVEKFFDWVDKKIADQGFLPSNPITTALAYAHKRRRALEVFLADPDVPMDTNHLERALRPIAMGRRSWLFCSTEVGARYVGIIQGLIGTCRLHDIDPYTYLVDVLQRVGQHPAVRVAELTPRLWKEHFAAVPLRSDVDAART